MADNIGHDDETSPMSPCQLVMKDKFIRLTVVLSTRNSIYSASSNQDEERDRILKILKLGHELRDGEKTTKQKYYWKQEDARNLKVIHAHLFFVNMQLFVVSVTRISALFSFVLSVVE
jgi:hypothetical protein